MGFWVSVIFTVFGIVAFVVCSILLDKKYENLAIICLVGGLVSICFLALSPLWNLTGLPLQNIDPGTYKVGFVYVAGENVNVAVEWRNDEYKNSSEQIYLYQFKKEAFEGTLNPNAKKLVVVQSRSFKKLRLE